MNATMTRKPSRPSEPADGSCTGGSASLDEVQPHAIIGEMAGVLRDTRSNMSMSGCVLSAITIGIALEAGLSGPVLQPAGRGVLNVALLCGLLLCWLRAVILLALAGRPVLNALSELRWVTGAPLDPRAKWLMLPSHETDSEQWTWIRAHLLLGAARLARYRTHLADTWTYITVGFFLVWTAAILLGL